MNPLEAVIALGTWAQQHPTPLLSGLAAVPLLAGGVGLMQRHTRRAQHTHGSARWATAGEIRQAGLYARHGVVVGRWGRRVLHDDRETHVLLTGPTRSGKGTSVIIPTLLTWRERALIFEAKDGVENHDVPAPWRSQFSHVHAFTPCRSPHARINVVDTIRLQTRHEFGDAQLIAQSLTAPEKMQHESATSLHFRELASLLLTAAILHVCYTARVRSLAAVWHLLTQQHTSLSACLQTMATTAHHSHGKHQAIVSMTTAIKNISGDRELSSVWTTAIRPLVLYSDPLIAASTDTSTLTLEHLQYGTHPMTLTLVAPSPMALERLHPLYRVIIDVAMERLMSHRLRTWRHRLFVCGDELPAYGYTRAVDKGLAIMAGYGIKALLVTQDFPALESVYGANSAIWGNTDLKIFFAPTNDLTAKRISAPILGPSTVEHPVESRQGWIGGRTSVSLQHVARPLLTPDEVMELPPHLQVMRLSGMKPIRAQKVNYRTETHFQRRLR